MRCSLQEFVRLDKWYPSAPHNRIASVSFPGFPFLCPQSCRCELPCRSRSAILGAGLMETTTTVTKRAHLQEVGAPTAEGARVGPAGNHDSDVMQARGSGARHVSSAIMSFISNLRTRHAICLYVSLYILVLIFFHPFFFPINFLYRLALPQFPFRLLFFIYLLFYRCPVPVLSPVFIVFPVVEF